MELLKEVERRKQFLIGQLLNMGLRSSEIHSLNLTELEQVYENEKFKLERSKNSGQETMDSRGN